MYRYIYLIGIRKRNPNLLSHYNLLKNSENWNLEKLKAYQLDKLIQFLDFSNKYSPYYNNIFNKISLNLKKINSIEDIKMIPTISKTTLLEYNKDIHSKYYFKKRFLSETSGSTGEVLIFYKNEEWDSFNRASMFRGYSWYNVNPWDKNGYFWGYNFDNKSKVKTFIEDFLQNRFRIFSYNYKEIKKFSYKLRNALFLSGYSSMIYEVSKIINELGLNGEYQLKMIKGTSEKIYDSYQDEVKKAFGSKIISEYGASESGLIAFECPEGGNMHINMENLIVEEEKGEIIVTNLISHSFPIIRYKLGDYIKLMPEGFKCKCGRSHPIISDVLGRTGKNIIGFKNIYPSLTFYYVFKNLSTKHQIYLNYQAIQTTKGEIILKIEQNEDANLLILKRELFKYFKDDINFNILWGKKLHKMNGKLKDFLTYIDK